MTLSISSTKTTARPSRLASVLGVAFDIFLLLLVLTGVAARFMWVNWSSGANLHPDEYGLTNTLTQLSIPKSLGDYFNTRISSISPYDKYDPSGNKIASGPDNSLRWGQLPITILRAAAEITGNTGYDDLRLMGRQLSALADTISLLLLFLIGRRLFNSRVALLATAFSALAVLQIQQSHFMTVDNFAVMFSTLAMYIAVRIAQQPSFERSGQPAAEGLAPDYIPARSAWALYALFGVTFGMTLASRINLAPLFGMLLVAAFISVAGLHLRSRRDAEQIVLYGAALMAVAALAAVVTFRVTQPMSFRATTGDTTLLTLQVNPTWIANMQQASQESSGIGGGPPQEQWANRPAIFFPLENMVLWGMGLPMGLAVWAGVGWSLWQSLRWKNWQAHWLPLIYSVGYFGYMGTRWVKSIRYFLPIYPFLALLGAAALLAWWDWSREKVSAHRGSPARSILPGLAIGLVTVGTLAWACMFVQAVYMQDHTRIQASRWILHNVPAPFDVMVGAGANMRGEPVAAPDHLPIVPGQPYVQNFTTDVDGPVTQITVAHAAAVAGTGPMSLRVQLALDPGGSTVLGETTLKIDPAAPGSDPRGGPVQAAFNGVQIHKGTTYYLLATALDGQAVISHTVISNETWDEGLPVRVDGYDPFGQFYTGVDMQIRFTDTEEKRQGILDALSQADVVILPSQRAIWAASRIPLTYPLTMEYYRALFGGDLGFQQAAMFEAPLHLGPLYVSDLAGRVAWGHPPALPLFNYSQIAAEETFSVYDHPPVWIFEKTPAYTQTQATRILDSVDLSKVIVQSPKDATPPEKLGIH
jgi:hypothetical protein